MTGPTSMPDLLAEHGIRTKRMTPGHTEKALCPSCDGGRTRELSLSVRFDDDGQGAAWNCKRGNCAFKGGGRVHGEDGRAARAPVREPAPVQKPPPHPVQPRPRALYAFFEERGISADTVDAFGCYIATHWFPPPIERERPAIVFPYLLGGQVVNRKYRPPEKSPMMSEKDALPTLFNVDSIDGPDIVHWVEGEADCMAMHEAGYRQVVTLKDGAGDTLHPEDDPRRETDRRYLALATHAELLNSVQRFVLAGDGDKPGAVLREELARRLGRHRCWLVTWPDGCKDAGDVLRTLGPAAVQAAVDAAQPYPIEGIQRLTGAVLTKLRHMPPPPVLSTGCGATDAILHLPGEGRLIVVTGLPNAGKSAWVTFVMVHTALTHDRKWAVFSPEMQPWEHYAAGCASVFMGKPFWPERGEEGLSDVEIAHAERWLQSRVTFLVSDAEDMPPTNAWLLERAGICVLRDGTTDLLIDPWNEVEHDKGTAIESEYIGRSLQRWKAFGMRRGCNVWIVAHPSKMQASKPGAALGPPGLYDISGSAAWANKADLAVTVHTPEQASEIHLMKCRFRRFGRKGSKATLNFNPATGRYASQSAQSIMDQMPERERAA